ncbi:bifunctional 2-C-methyl-D-erythritol 4-phosphate cytidylyltransferase/2-C-methyl-D-erythritol 2,4-cyclodiphosphate synthase [soil metagenome]
MEVAGLIVAAGRGERLGGGEPKQYRRLGRGTVLGHAVAALLGHAAVSRLLVVIHEGDRERYEAAARGMRDARLMQPVPGGETRSASVLAGLEALASDAPDVVLIHDAARPFASHRLIDGVLGGLRNADGTSDVDGAFPALPVVDALWRAEAGLAASPVARDDLYRAQTPQGFRFAPIFAAHRACRLPAADDVALARAAGLRVRCVPGDERNFKITAAHDLERARRIEGAEMDVRTGSGFDVHRFGAGGHVTLCGVRVPHDRGLIGHSDADVALHALTDAIFGALAEGDIGQWFPPSDPEWKGAASEIFLARAMERVAARGFALTHLDLTLICETPRIGPHAASMREALARMAGIEPGRVSVKATTSEGLGFTGRDKGIAALASATLVRA